MPFHGTTLKGGASVYQKQVFPEPSDMRAGQEQRRVRVPCTSRLCRPPLAAGSPREAMPPPQPGPAPPPTASPAGRGHLAAKKHPSAGLTQTPGSQMLRPVPWPPCPRLAWTGQHTVPRGHPVSPGVVTSVNCKGHRSEARAHSPDVVATLRVVPELGRTPQPRGRPGSVRRVS